MDTSLALILLGAVVSLIIQFVKKYSNANTLALTLAVVVLSVIGGIASWYLKLAGLWDSTLQILTAAGAVYTFIIKNAESASPAFAAFFASPGDRLAK